MDLIPSISCIKNPAIAHISKVPDMTAIGVSNNARGLAEAAIDVGAPNWKPLSL